MRLPYRQACLARQLNVHADFRLRWITLSLTMTDYISVSADLLFRFVHS